MNEKKKFQMPHIFIILYAIILVIAALSYILPAGEYTRVLDPNTGREIIDPNSYHVIASTPTTVMQLFQAFPSGFVEAGWVVVNNNRNYVRYIDPKTGKYVKNTTRWINGMQYRFDSRGYRVNDRTNEFRRSSYYLTCDRVNGVLTVYTDSTMRIPIKTIRVSVGKAGTETPTGTWTMHRAGRWQELMGPSWGQYGTHVVNGIFVHSVACGQANSYNLPVGEYLRLGNPASHGCIRACVADAKWVWDNCNGSKIRIFDGTYTSNEALKGPLGRKALTPLRGSKNFDPTDPACK